MKFNFNTLVLVATLALAVAAIYFNFLTGDPVTFRQ